MTFAQALLESLPRRHAVPRRFFCAFRHVVAGGLAVLATIADVQVRTMLGSATLLAMTAGPPAGAIGFRQRAEHGHVRGPRDLAQQRAPLGAGVTHPRHHASASWLGVSATERWRTDSS